MSELQWHSRSSKMLPKGQNHTKHCAHWWFQTASVQRKQLTSICQNYNGTAAEGDRGWPSVHCQRQTGRPRLISSFYSYLGIATVLHSDTIVDYLANSIADIPRFGAKCPCPSGQNAPVQMAADNTFKNKKMHK